MDNEHTTMFMLSNDQSDGFWLKQMRNGGATSILKKTKQLANMDAFWETFKEQLKSCGMVLWDPDVPATANVAVTVCGTDGYLPVMEGGAVYEKACRLSALKLLNLCDKFTGVEGTKIPDTDVMSSEVRNATHIFGLLTSI